MHISSEELKNEIVNAINVVKREVLAKHQNSDQYVLPYSRAIVSLQKFPTDSLTSLYDLTKVPGIGTHILNGLIKHFKDKGDLQRVANGKSEEYLRGSQKTISRTEITKVANKRNTSSVKEPAPKKRKTATKKQYIPKRRSGSYAIILALLECYFMYSNSMVKDQIIEYATVYCDSGFISNSSTAEFYTAWSSMKTLLTKNIVEILNGKSKPSRYGLTTEGLVLAATLKKINNILFDRNGSDFELQWRQNWNELYKDKIDEENLDINKELFFSLSSLSFDSGSQSYETASKRPDDNNKMKEKNDQLQYMNSLQATDSRTFRELIEGDNIQRMNTSISSNNSINYSFNKSFLSNETEAHQTIKTFQRQPENIKVINEPQLKNTRTLTSSISSKTAKFNNILYQVWNWNEYEIILLIDNREIRGTDDRNFFMQELQKNGIKCEVRQLNIGDFIWIAKHKTTMREVFLNAIIERKRIDDLCSSIKDGRFHEQKERLKKTGYKWCFYLVEESVVNSRLMNMAEAIKTAFFETSLDSGFILHRCKNASETVTYLIMIHNLISQRLLLAKKSIIMIEKGDFNDQQELHDTLLVFRKEFEQRVNMEGQTLKNPHRNQRLFECCHNFSTFHSVMGKSSFLTAHELYLRILLSVKGCSLEKAFSVVTRYPTFADLINGYKSCKSKKESQLFLYDKFDMYPTQKKIGKSLSEKFHETFGKKF
ncbi:hypothetical protein ACO0R3_003287 [Hanseniaspora guilliermondii]